jgi:hypothetical protein
MCQILRFLVMWTSGASLCPARPLAQEPSKPYVLFEQPGTMVRLPQGNRLSMHCDGAGSVQPSWRLALVVGALFRFEFSLLA